ncbi:unnamed protein product [Prorocentrum cordatum]|uniref:Rab-GAP TBC domain-containing protein n=1 Tax=Prorocentrum cordatum TaxID=2364126 RepID=A0ABN9XHB6_9DINO|nr:unnamed protein product [Polarella glacialis]
MHLRWGAALAGRQPWELSAEELRPLLAGGMPLKHRLALWPRWFSLPPGAVGRVEELCGQASGAAAAQIELDMPRTHPQWPLGDAARHTLRRVLLACAARYPEVGYCQGMGHMAATLIILGFDEDLALRGLCSLMESCCEGYHDAGLSGWRQDANVLGELATRTLSPEALRRLQVVDVPLEVLASEHFLTVGSRSWPLEAALRLWDLALLDGPSAVFCSFLALLELFLPSVQGEADLEAEPVELFRERALLGLAENPVEVLECTQRRGGSRQPGGHPS